MDKFQKVLSLLKNYYKDKIKINYSPSSGYRSRCEFGYKNNFYNMYSSLGEIIYLESFSIARPCIQKLMPNLLDKINNQDILKERLFQINFRANRDDEILVSMIYHRPIYDEIKSLANELADILNIKINFKYSTKKLILCNLISSFFL